MGDKKIAFRANLEKGTRVPFRKNWWSHICKDGKKVWKHRQYMRCDKCGYHNGYMSGVKGMRTL